MRIKYALIGAFANAALMGGGSYVMNGTPSQVEKTEQALMDKGYTPP